MIWLGFWEAFRHIVASPFKDLNVLWQLIPIFLMWLILEVYFTRWKEELGWNSALANAITLFWIVISMLQVIFGSDQGFPWLKMILLAIGLLYAIFLVSVVFRHSLRDKVTYRIASPVLIYYLCVVFVVWGHGLLEITWQVVVVLFILFWVMALIDFLLKKLVPKRVATTDDSDSSGTLSGLDWSDSLSGRSHDASQPSLEPFRTAESSPAIGSAPYSLSSSPYSLGSAPPSLSSSPHSRIRGLRRRPSPFYHH